MLKDSNSFRIVENESKSSPSKAGDIVESHAFQEWKEQKKNQLFESLVETIAPFTHEPLEFNKVPEAIQKRKIDVLCEINNLSSS